ncbi:hypothetical protein Noda2021_05220 [Candidatus Dependentiae bacterium Noda2021]|nr:hypothetical protein Noda2021_05220 [Candidatus Dependentiae bacterium Noda2021]
MKRIIIVLLCIVSTYCQARDIQANVEIRNHEKFPIFVRTLQKGQDVIDRTVFPETKTHVKSAIGDLILINGKSGNAIDSWAGSVDPRRATYFQVSYKKGDTLVTEVYATPEKRTLYVAYDNGSLRPQKGKFFSNFTQSGFPLVENVKPYQVVRLTDNQVAELNKSLELEAKTLLNEIQNMAPDNRNNDANYDDLTDEEYEQMLRKRLEELKKY